MTGYANALYGWTAGDRVVHHDHGCGTVEFVGPEAYTRDLGMYVLWDSGSRCFYLWNATRDVETIKGFARGEE